MTTAQSVSQTAARAAVDTPSATCARPTTETSRPRPIVSMSPTAITFYSPDRAQPFHLRGDRLPAERRHAPARARDEHEHGRAAVGRASSPSASWATQVSSVTNTTLVHLPGRDRRGDIGPDEGQPHHRHRAGEAGRSLELRRTSRARRSGRHDETPVGNVWSAEDGIALVMVLGLTLLLGVFAVTVMSLVTSETSRSAHAVTRQTSFEAAEAGIDAYTSKLLEDNQYYGHQVAAGESTRRSSTGTLVAAGGTGARRSTWTYPNGHDAWAPLANGYEYNLQISPPDAGESDGRSPRSDAARRHRTCRLA